MRSATRGYSDFEGKRILTLDGGYAGKDGVCLGKIGDHPWAVLPDGSDEMRDRLLPRLLSGQVDIESEHQNEHTGA